MTDGPTLNLSSFIFPLVIPDWNAVACARLFKAARDEEVRSSDRVTPRVPSVPADKTVLWEIRIHKLRQLMLNFVTMQSDIAALQKGVVLIDQIAAELDRVSFIPQGAHSCLFPSQWSSSGNVGRIIAPSVLDELDLLRYNIIILTIEIARLQHSMVLGQPHSSPSESEAAMAHNREILTKYGPYKTAQSLISKYCILPARAVLESERPEAKNRSIGGETIRLPFLVGRGRHSCFPRPATWTLLFFWLDLAAKLEVNMIYGMCNSFEKSSEDGLSGFDHQQAEVHLQSLLNTISVLRSQLFSSTSDACRPETENLMFSVGKYVGQAETVCKAIILAIRVEAALSLITKKSNAIKDLCSDETFRSPDSELYEELSHLVDDYDTATDLFQAFLQIQKVQLEWLLGPTLFRMGTTGLMKFIQESKERDALCLITASAASLVTPRLSNIPWKKDMWQVTLPYELPPETLKCCRAYLSRIDESIVVRNAIVDEHAASGCFEAQKLRRKAMPLTSTSLFQEDLHLLRLGDMDTDECEPLTVDMKDFELAAKKTGISIPHTRALVAGSASRVPGGVFRSAANPNSTNSSPLFTPASAPPRRVSSSSSSLLSSSSSSSVNASSSLVVPKSNPRPSAATLSPSTQETTPTATTKTTTTTTTSTKTGLSLFTKMVLEPLEKPSPPHPLPSSSTSSATSIKSQSKSKTLLPL